METGSSKSAIPWPEDYSGLREPLLAELGGESRVYLHRVISEGKSGAQVMAADVTSERFTGQAILKLDHATGIRRKEALEHERHERAIIAAPEYAEHYLPKLVCAIQRDDQVAALTTIAARGLEYAIAWSDCPYGPQLETALRLSEDLLERWNADYTLDPEMLTPQDLLSGWLDYRLSRERGSRIHSFLEDICGLDPEASTFVFDGDWFPNPLAFANGQVSLLETARLRAIKGNQHGDLHGKNVLVTKQFDVDPHYYLIDLDFYRDDGFLFYDHGIFELDYLLTSRERFTPGHWKIIMHNLQRNPPLNRDAGLLGADIGILQLVREFRDRPKRWVDRHQPNRLSFLESQYLLARLAAGMAVSHQRRSDASRALGFLYGAYNLKDYLSLHDFNWPKHGPEFAIGGLFSRASAGYAESPSAPANGDRGPAQPAGRPPKLTVAVLPLTCSEETGPLADIADDLTDGLITELSRIDWFTTIRRSATQSFAGRQTDPQSAGRELKARYVAQGNVRRAENVVQLSVQLIETDTGDEVWSERFRFDPEIDDVFANEDIVVSSAAAVIDAVLDRNERDRAMRGNLEEAGAWELIQRARWHFYQVTPEDDKLASGFAERAIELSPGYSSPHAMLAHIKNRSVFYGWTESSQEVVAEAVNLARHAVSLDPGSSYAHETLARAYMFAGRHGVAIREAETAVSLNPSSSSAHLWLAICLLWAGKPAEAIPVIDLSMRLGPFNQWRSYKLSVNAAAYFFLGRVEKAEELCRQAMDSGHGHMVVELFLALMVSLQGRTEEAQGYVNETMERRPDLTCTKIRGMLSGIKPDLFEPLVRKLASLGVPE